MSYTLPSDADQRPIVIVGAGALGRRIAAVHAAGGSDVRLVDTSEKQRRAALEYVHGRVAEIRQKLGLRSSLTGRVEAVDDLKQALEGAWLVIEAVPEKPEVKRNVLSDLDRLAPADAIVGSNSSSLPTSQLIDRVEHPERVLNVHYQMPPEHRAVELMSDGKTDTGIIDALMKKLPDYGLVPFHVRRESDGFIFNRIWAAIKRECLMVVEEGVATPEDVDSMWELFTNPSIPPFRLMDQIGLDVVLDIEEHYAAVRPGISEGPRKVLREYIAQGRLGNKSGRGFYDRST